jgi:predicted dinucleotide-binding enzyme
MRTVNITIIGAGNIGGTLARKWARDHRVTLGVRDPHKSEVEHLLAELGTAARATLISDAVDGADAVLFAVPGKSMQETVASMGHALDTKVVFDATNNIGGNTFNSVAALTSAAPRAHIYRAFNTYGWENFETPVFGGTAADLFYAGPDGDPRNVAEQLISEVGLRPVWLGGLDKAGLVDSLLPLWFTLSSERGLGRHFAFKILRT